MAENLVLLSLLLLFLARVVSGTSAGNGSECQRQCGNVAVPYPFGISHKGSALDNSSNIGCFRGSPFNLTCNVTYRPPKLFWGRLEVSNISLDTAEITVQALMSYECDNSTVSMARGNDSGYISLNGHWPFTFSERNHLVTMGCDITSTLRGYWGHDAVSSCTALCSTDALMADGSCDGFGCCQIPIAKGVKKYTIAVRRYSDEWYKYSRCGFGFLADQESFKFKKSYLTNYSFYSERNRSFPVVVDWAINNTTCDVAQTSADYACKDASAECISSKLGRTFSFRSSNNILLLLIYLLKSLYRSHRWKEVMDG